MSGKTRRKQMKANVERARMDLITDGLSEIDEKPFAQEPKHQRKGLGEYEGNNKFLRFYFKHWKMLALIPLLLLIMSIGIIGHTVYTTGEFVNKGISLKGGTTYMITKESIDFNALRDTLREKYPGHEIDVKSLTEGNLVIGATIETDMLDEALIAETVSFLKSEYSLSNDDLTIETMGSSLGDTFFTQVFKALIIAFVLMSIVVFIYFKNFVPSFAVIFCAFSDMVVTLAVVDLFNIKLTTAGVAAFLMLIGYSIDTDMLLTIKVMKDKEHSFFYNVHGAMKTGTTMTLTALAAVGIALIFAQSDVLKQIMTVLFIGLIADLLYTWVQNVAILRWYYERKGTKDGKD